MKGHRREREERDKKKKLVLIPNPEVSHLKAYRCACLNSTLRKKKHLPHTPHPTNRQWKRQEEQVTHRKQLIPILDQTNLVNSTSEQKRSSPLEGKTQQAARGCSMASFIAIPNSRSMCNWLFCFKKGWGGKKEKKIKHLRDYKGHHKRRHE